MREFIVGDVVKHFKRETVTAEEMTQKKYLYRIIGFATYTESGEDLVVYQALYGNMKVYARPKDMFLDWVDKEKYPNIKQEYRFELAYRESLIQM